MEKPMGHTLEDGHAIVEGCHRHGVLLSVSFVHRYRTEFQWAHRLIAEGQIGTAAMVVDKFCTRGGSHVPDWVWAKDQAGGGVLMYTGIHSIDRLRWLVGSEVEEVFARTRTYSQEVAVEDGLLATLSFANGCLATLIENCPNYVVTSRPWETEIYGSQGWIRARHGDSVEFSSNDRAFRLEVAHDDWWGAQAREFVAAVREGRKPWISGEDGLRALEIAMAIYRSAESGRVVSLSEARK
jgi:predicted dehydrogenase